MRRDRDGGATPAILGERVLSRREAVVYALLSLLALFAAAALAYHWISLEFDLLTGLATLLIGYVLAGRLATWLALPAMRRPQALPPLPGLRVGVATSFVAGAESLEMLEQTVAALVALEYPHETWVLDESDDPRVRTLCTRLGARHFSRHNRPEYQHTTGPFLRRHKVGNYNSWLHEVGFRRYDVISTFDPDQVPRPDYLDRMLGYFSDPRVAYVAAAQAFYNQAAGFIARGSAEETYHHYSINQMAAHAWGYPLINGGHQVHRVSALRQLGGFPAHDGDDLLLTLLYRSARWRGAYLPEILARGLATVDWGGYLAQQSRWARSVVDIKIRPFRQLGRRLPLRERLVGYVHGIHYLRPLCIPVVLAMLAFMLASGAHPEFVSPRTAVFALPLLAALMLGQRFQQRFYLDQTTERGVHWRARLLEYAKWPYVLNALVEVLGNRNRPFTVTPKAPTENGRRWFLWPQLVVAGALAAAWLAGWAGAQDPHPVAQAAAAAVIVLSLGLTWTELWRYPEPYDPRLLESWQEPVRSTALGPPSEATDAERGLDAASEGMTWASPTRPERRPGPVARREPYKPHRDEPRAPKADGAA